MTEGQQQIFRSKPLLAHFAGSRNRERLRLISLKGLILLWIFALLAVGALGFFAIRIAVAIGG